MRIITLLSVVLAASCSSLPSDPNTLGDQIIAELDAGMVAQAHASFGQVERDPIWRESLYPVFFAEARSRYEAGDFAGSSAILRFSVTEYAGARSLHEALLYSLFQLRAQTEDPDPSLILELEQVVRGFQDSGGYSPWSDLIAAQTAIDLGRPQEAIGPYQRFRAAWDGIPPELETYVQDIGRYLETPPAHSDEHSDEHGE